MFNGAIYFLKLCWKFDKKYILLLITKNILNTLLTLSLILLPKFIIDALFVKTNFELAIFFILISLFLSFFSNIAINYLTNISVIRKMIVFKEFQLYLSEITTKIDYEKMEDPEYLDTREKAYKYLYGNGSGFAQILENAFDLLGKFITLLGVIIIILQLNFILIVILLAMVIINTIIDSKTKLQNLKLNLEKVKHERRGIYFTNILSDFRYGKEIRSYNLSNWLISKYAEQLNLMQNFYKKISKNNIKFSNITSITSLIQQALMYFYLINKVMINAVTIGDFSMYINSISQFNNILTNILQTLIDLRQYNDYYLEFKKFISMKNISTINSNINISKLNIDTNNIVIEFKNVFYKYKGQSTYALENINVVLKSQEKVAIVGENGSGKSTFIKLLMRIYTPTKGQILINDIDIQTINYNDYLNLLSATFQDFKLFSMSIEENISLGEFNHDPEYMNKIITNIALENKVNSLEKGLDTYVYKDFGDYNFEPSGGEGQKIAISRCMYKNTPIIILDEPTAALDFRSEMNIYKQFNELFNDKLIIFISHRFTITKFTNKILVFKSGKIIEEGNHDELISLNGDYAELFNMQSKFFV